MSGISVSRRAGSFGRSGGVDRTHCRGRPVRADRTQCQGTSPVHDGRCGGVERTPCRCGRRGHDDRYGTDRIPHLGGRVGGVARRAAAGSARATVASPHRGPQTGLPGGRSDRADRTQCRGASRFREGGSVRTDRTQYAGGLPGRADRTRSRGARREGPCWPPGPMSRGGADGELLPKSPKNERAQFRHLESNARARFSHHPHVVAASASDVRTVPGQLRVDAKTNEHKAALELLGALSVKAKVVSGDALFTHREVCAEVIAGESTPSLPSRPIIRRSGRTSRSSSPRLRPAFPPSRPPGARPKSTGRAGSDTAGDRRAGPSVSRPISALVRRNRGGID